MTTTSPTTAHAPSPPREAARFMAAYAKRYAAGAFATPTGKEIAQLQAGHGGHWVQTPGMMAAAKQLTRDSIRRDFTGRGYTIDAGARIVTHLAAEPDALLPDLSWADMVYAYAEDTNVTDQLRHHREPVAVRVSASSEIITAWGAPGTGHHYRDADTATIRNVPLHVGDDERDAITAEVAELHGWTDDFPFYSDGSWAALNLRGYRRDDPTWGIKPAEMSKSWKAQHPDTLDYRCGWTVLADRCPATVTLTRKLFAGRTLERVRLLRMAGRGGRGGKLARHSDITDKAAGTADGRIARFHIPLVTHPDITMTGWNLEGRRAAVHLPAWTGWYLDARKPHAVTNPTGTDRVHLVVDVVADPAVRALIAAGTEHVR